MKRLIVLLLAFAVLLGGCSGPKNALGFSGVVEFGEMKYLRPDLDEAGAIALAAVEAVEAGEEAETVVEAVWEYFDAYNRYTTNYNLAYIHYHADLTDFYWRTEQEFCAENMAQMDLFLEDIYCAIADSPLRTELEEDYFGEGYFDGYASGGFYDEALLALLEREQELIGEYYAFTAGVEAEEYSDAWFDECTLPLTELLAKLVAVRQEIAAQAGYSSYPAFAWDYYYYRDYTLHQADRYLEAIRLGLVPLYQRVNESDAWDPYWESCSQERVFGYVKTAAEAMGGVTAEAFRLLEEARLYDISASEKKSGISFELYLNSYYEPYVFVSAAGTQYDCLTFAHEFGHFACDYAAAGSIAGTDVLEIFSQGMEYLSLCYADADPALTGMKLADSLGVYVEQAAYAAFERKMYSLTGEDLTAQRLLELYDEVCRSYGFGGGDWDPRDLVTIPHFYSNPMYIISYVVSNDAAMQLYELELQTPGAGRDCFLESLTTESGGLMEFLEEAGLESPFTRVAKVKALMEERFGA